MADRGEPTRQLRCFGVNAGLDGSLSTYLLNQCQVLVHYVTLLVWPRDLVLDYGPVRPVALRDVWPQGFAILATISGTLYLWLRRPLYAMPMMWVLVVLAPTTLVPIVLEVGADRRMYLASVGPIVDVTVAAAVLLRSRHLRIGIAVIAVLALAALTIIRNGEYESPYRMWSTVVDRWPHGRAYQNLAVEAEAAGRHDEVLPLLRRAGAETADARYALGVKLYQAREYDAAIDNLISFINERPGHHQIEGARQTLIRCWTDLGILRVRAGQFGLAVDAFREALALEPANPQLQRNLAEAVQDAQAGAPR